MTLHALALTGPGGARPPRATAHLDSAHTGDIIGAFGTIAETDTGARRGWRRRLLTLAAIGNFTTARAAPWRQPLTVSVVPETGLFVIDGDAASSDAALRVLLLIMCAVMFKRWMEDEARALAGGQATARGLAKRE